MKTFEVVRVEDGQVIGEGVEFTPLSEAADAICVVLWREPPNMEAFASPEALIGKVVEPGVVEIHPIGAETSEPPARARTTRPNPRLGKHVQ